MSLTQRNVLAALPPAVRGRSVNISGDPKGVNFLYCHGNSVIIRNIDNPGIVDIYHEHIKPTTCAKYSPSGFYIASGDIAGSVRVWDTVNKEHILKIEHHPFAGMIKDIAWDIESKRICAVGEGREKYGHVFTYDSGNSVGSVTGHSKLINSVDFKPTRPFRMATASEDFSVAFFEGPPFNFKHSLTDHKNFVNALRYAPDGSVFITGGQDGEAFIYDGKTGEKVGQLGEKAHEGGIYSVCFNPTDPNRILTASGDKTAKIWDVETRSVVTTFSMGTEIQDQQLGCLWQGPHLLTVSLSGFINYLDPNNPSRPLRIIKGDNKPITAMTVSEDRSKLFTGSSSARINWWDYETGDNDQLRGKGHSNQIQDMQISGDKLITVSMDDTCIVSSVSVSEYGSDRLKLESQPKSVATIDGLTVIASISHVIVLQSGHQVFSEKVNYSPTSVAMHPGKTAVAVGGQNEIKIYELSNGALSETQTIEGTETITDVKYSPDGTYLAAVGVNRKCAVYSYPDYERVSANVGHDAKITSVDWSPDSQLIATGSLDSSIAIWKMQKGVFQRKIKEKVHLQSQVNRVVWIDNNTVATAGQDSHVKVWTVSF